MPRQSLPKQTTARYRYAVIVERALTARADEEKFSPNRNCCDEDKIAKTFPSAASSSDGCKRILRCPVYFPRCRHHHVRSIRRPAARCVGRIDRQRHISAALGRRRRRHWMPSVTADGRTGLAHKCLQTPLTFARSLIPLDLSYAAAHYKRASAAATCEYVCRRSYDKKGRDDCGPRSMQPVSFYELTNWG